MKLTHDRTPAVLRWQNGDECCPYCGNEDISREDTDDGIGYSGRWETWTFRCRNCGCEFTVEFALEFKSLTTEEVWS